MGRVAQNINQAFAVCQNPKCRKAIDDPSNHWPGYCDRDCQIDHAKQIRDARLALETAEVQA